MKKKFLKALILGSLLSLSATAFANPFEFVPTSDWAYGALDNLSQAGIFQDYKDVNFNKDQSLTRYELAVLVGKAVANEKKANEDQKALINKLSVEFKDELNSLGVYPSLNTHNNNTAVAPTAVQSTAAPAAEDKIKFSGFYRLRYQTIDDNTLADNSRHAFYSRIELDATAKLTDGWTGNFAWEAYKNFYTDAGKASGTFGSAWGADGYNGVNDVTIANVTGPMMGTTMTLGRFNHTVGSGLMFDDSLSGVRFEFGKALKTKLVYAEADSNIEGNTPTNSYLSKLNKVLSAEFSYDLSKATTVTASWQNWKPKDADWDSMNVCDFNITTALNKDLSFYGTYDKTSADDNNRAYVVGVSYKVLDINKPGSYNAFLDYENFQQNTAIDTTYWMSPGSKGFALGFNYVPAKNVKWTNVFANPKILRANNLGVKGAAEEEGASQKFFRSQVFFYF